MKYVLLNKIKSNLLDINVDNYLVLKSNAYGFGLEEVLKQVKLTKLNKFCVITLKDALTIKNIIKDPIILLIVPFHIDDLANYELNNILLSISSYEEFLLIKDMNIKFQIKVNTGMNRFGIKDTPNDILQHPNLVGIYSHNATKSIDFINEQLSRFKSINIPSNIDVHYFSSSHPELSFGNCRRIGQDIYKDSLVIKAKVISYHYLKKGDYVGYDYTYCAAKDELIGVLDIGYADGLGIKCNGYNVYSENGSAKLIGISCMNHSFVLLENTDIKEVEIIGANNKIEYYEKFFNKTKHEIYIDYSLSENNYIY